MDQNFVIRRDLINALITILSKGIQTNQFDDSEKLLAAIAILNPKLECFGEFKSYIAIKRGSIQEALQFYIATPAETSKWYVMMALCLKLAQDPTWDWHAKKALEIDDSSSATYSHSLARVLLGLDEPDNAESAQPKQTPESDYPGSYTGYLAI